jgi:2-methylisocitrate lyase-like PEP mutase family enzyme
VGCKLEDSDPATRRLADPGAAGRAALGGRPGRRPLVINARVDTYLPDVDIDPDRRLAEALERGRSYRDAGADSVYPILVGDQADIAALVEGLGAVNVMIYPGAPGPARLAELGVARVSWGSGIHRRVMAGLRSLLAELAPR